MKQLYANGMTMSQILGFSKPIEERGQVLSNGQMPDQVRHDVLLGEEVQVKADLSIPAQVNTSFVPYITSVGKQCLQPMAYGIKLIAVLIFICCLFNNAAFGQSCTQSEAAAEVEEINKSKDRVALRAVRRSFAGFELPKGGLVPGDTLPLNFWDLSLTVKNYSSRLISLVNLKRDFLILEFWSSNCPSCIQMVDSLNRLQDQFGELITVLPINIFDSPEQAEAMIQKRGWTLPVAITYGDSLLNRLFLTHYDFRQIWIKDGRLLAIPEKEMVNEQVITDILMNRDVKIKMKDRYTYFDHRLLGIKKRKEDDENN